ncbi:multidrug resistance-associated ABC transporter [Abortiporus biennis]|nr:multidrug resistance-associated ABC transporter [Abortiporus biennis]
MRFRSTPAPPGFGRGKVVPEQSVNFLSWLSFSWLTPFLKVGFSRPLEKDDLWELPSKRLTANLSEDLERNFYSRCPPEKRPNSWTKREELDRASSVLVAADEKGLSQTRTQSPTIDQPSQGDGVKYDASIVKALHKTFLLEWWLAGLLELCSSTLMTTTPLVTKVFLTWLSESFLYYHASAEQRTEFNLSKPHGIGYGIGLAFALFAMQEVSSLLTNMYVKMTQSIGLATRTAVIGVVFRKSLRMSGKARVEHSVGQIATMITSDTAKLDQAAQYLHQTWIAPCQLIIGFALLIHNIGPSALVALGVMFVASPIQLIFSKMIFSQRAKGVGFTDSRVRLTTEILQGIRLIKFYAWESFFAGKIEEIRVKELRTLKISAIAVAMLIATVSLVPVLSTVLSFITYSLSGHNLNVAVIFTALQLFTVIRIPLLILPMVAAASADAMVALQRVAEFLLCDELEEIHHAKPEAGIAINVDADFEWERVEKPDANTKESDDSEKKPVPLTMDKERSSTSKEKDSTLPTSQPADCEKVEEKVKEEEKPFALKNIHFRVPEGSFVAIVGRVGSGKSSLLQGIIGEIRRTRGTIAVSSNVAYVPQVPWIMNASLRDNIIFGRNDNDERFREIVQSCCLTHDIERLPHGEQTEIGEKGINLSGGQKARVSLARAAYSNADIILMDDTLSAVDAYVGKRILEDCILHGPLAKKTRILATHALHVLDRTDYIYVMENGMIAEQGTYKELVQNSTLFSRVLQESRKTDEEDVHDNSITQASASIQKSVSKEKTTVESKDEALKTENAALMQEEERNTGSVDAQVYVGYLRYAGGIFWAPVIVLLLVLFEGVQVVSSIFLGFWTSESLDGFTQGDYMGAYAGFGAATALFSFLLNLACCLATLQASYSLFDDALLAVLRSAIAFFDTTPIGRITSRLSKDIDTMDAEVAMIGYQFLTTFSSVLGTAALVFYTFPYLGIAFAPLSVLYYLAAIYYRRTSVETKRLDSIMRSSLYASYSETLTGLSTVRGYGEQDRFIATAERGLDMENRAYYMTIVIQRWLGVRLDILGNLLILGIGLFAAGFRKSVDPSKIGVVLSYTLNITQVLSLMVSMYAQNEQNFNAVERILHYTQLPSEGDRTTKQDPPPSWPEHGSIEFKDVDMAYREGLPLVLKGVSFKVQAGEKVGVVGRTGAGKSSLLQALFRIVNVRSGSIAIDGYNINEVGLDTLRGKLALVPQDNTLFRGTLRDNIDPQRSMTDGELRTVLQKACLVSEHDGDPAADNKFDLDAVVSDEGSNYSTGEKQLLALCRALVKNSKIIVLDEATSSVDVETDAKLQKTIQTELTGSTLVCIAHRLKTIVNYDRILVMDEGHVAEFDTPINLFNRESSIFRSLCDEANLTYEQILHLRT